MTFDPLERTAAMGLGAVGVGSAALARVVVLLAQSVGEAQFAHAWPLIAYVAVGLGSTIAVIVATIRIGWNVYIAAQGAVSKIAQEAVRAAVLSEREAHNGDVAEIREELARLRGELGMIRRFIMADAGASPPPVEPRG